MFSKFFTMTCIKELEKKSKGQYDYFGENAEQYKTFFIPIEKKLQKMIKMVMKCYNYILQNEIY